MDYALFCWIQQVPKTLDNTREVDETIVEPDDEEVMQVSESAVVRSGS
jgi:hypothetical protein